MSDSEQKEVLREAKRNPTTQALARSLFSTTHAYLELLWHVRTLYEVTAGLARMLHKDPRLGEIQRRRYKRLEIELEAVNRRIKSDAREGDVLWLKKSDDTFREWLGEAEGDEAGFDH